MRDHASTFAIIATVVLGLAACLYITSAATPKAVILEQGQTTTLSDGLKIKEVEIGTGPEAKSGEKVKVHYTGKLASNGKVFDSGDITFPLGAGQVIKGWDEGLQGMKVGGKRKLVIPPALGYGAAGTPGGPIPPNAILDFDVHLLGTRM